MTGTLADIQQRQSELIRKALEGSVFIAPASADPVTTMTSGAGADLAPLPAGYVDVGMIEKKNAITWSRKVTTTDVNAWGDIYPARRDITKDDSQLKFTMLETKRQSLELYYGLDLSAAAPDATSGEVSFAQPARPDNLYYRVFGLFQDGVGSDAIYVGRFYPRASVTDMNDQKWDDDADPMLWDISMSAVTDSAVGYPVKHFFGGPGWKSFLDDMGFGLSAPTSLTKGTVTSTTVPLTWDAVTGATSYQVQKSTDSGSTWTDVLVGAGGTPSTATTTVTGLTTATAYQFRVAGVVSGTRGSYSAPVSATTS